MKIYIEHKINSEADLPKKVGDYLVKLNNGSARLLHFPFDGDVGYNIFKSNWIEDVNYWLEPVEISDGAEEILTKIALSHERKYASFPALIENESSVDVYEMIITAMQEFATIQVSKDRAEHLLLEVKTQPTDQEIKEWALNYIKSALLELLPNDGDCMAMDESKIKGFYQCLVQGAKAALSGEIKKKCQE